MAGLINPPATVVDPSLRVYLEQVAIILRDIQGDSGNPAIRLNQLIAAGLVDAGGNIVPPNEGEYNALTDFTIPPPPNLFEAVGTFESIILSWAPLTVIERMVSYTEVYRSLEDDVGSAVLVGVSAGSIYTDAVGPSSEFYYWARHRSYADVPGPFNSLDGTAARTADDPSRLLEALNDSITESQLFNSLNSRIDLIDTPETGLVTKVSELDTLTENQVRDIQQLSQNVEGNVSSIEQQGELIDGVRAQYSVKIDVNGNVAGYGLSSTPTGYDGAQHSKMVFLVDNFSIASPGATKLSFVVDNGKVLMNAAYLVNATITNAKIKSLAADKIYAASGTIASALIGDADISNAMIGNLIQSNGYSSNSGWKINKDGTAIFRNMYARGNIEADRIKANSVNIIDTLMVKGQAITFSSGSVCASGSSSGAYKKIFDGTYNPEGGKLQLIFTCHVSSEDGGLSAEIRINGRRVQVTKARIRADSGVDADWDLPLSLQYTTAATSAAQRVQVYMAQNGDPASWSDAYITATELKR